ncbi:hypothetical protein N5U04_09860 [Aliarcobacter butzleri]|uniref:hypothetical protein n=1 Tax=Aliarcobacter butzleri TaxID=28197 RepID=UPI0021B4427B|nr:hypothetical protein [Aliarcobacter butzleri]MCT7549817.1 hypothetical protein [Aliarcobacter butzleri]MCT7559873.1 hypothetical protein [Aliarcobacter butzleri]
MPKFDVPKLADYSGAIQANQSFQNAFRNLGQQSQDFLNYEEQKRKNQQDESMQQQNYKLNLDKHNFEQTKYKNEFQDKEDAKVANRTTFQTLYPEQFKSFGEVFGQSPTVENADRMNNVLGNVDLNNFDKNRTFNYNANKDQKNFEYQQNRDRISDGFEREKIGIQRMNASKPSYSFQTNENGSIVAINQNDPTKIIDLGVKVGNEKKKEQQFDWESKLRSEFSKGTSNYIQAKSNYAKINAANDNAVGDISLIFSYMKMLDPQSVVREGEFATAQNAAGIDDRIQNTYNKLLSGERLSPQQRIDFKKQSEDLYKIEEENAKKLRQSLGLVAKTFKLDEKNIFGEEEQPTQPVVTPIPTGNPQETPILSKTIVKTQKNPKTGEIRYIYSDGSIEYGKQ